MHKAFYCDNGGPLAVEFQAAFHKVMNSLQCQGFAYSGLDARARNSSLHREITDDFYGADHIVSVFIKEPADSWVVPEIRTPWPRKGKIFAFAARLMSESECADAAVSDVVFVIGPGQFENELTRRLKTTL